MTKTFLCRQLAAPNLAVERTAGSPSLAAAAHRARSAAKDDTGWDHQATR